MKHTHLLLFLLLWSAAMQAQHHHEPAAAILTVEQMPHAEAFLPDYARPGDPLFHNDSVMYETGKTLRGTPRGELARADASTSLSYFLKRFGPAMQIDTLSSRSFPAVGQLVNSTLTLARQSIQSTKNHFKRERPYAHFKQPSALPQQEQTNDLTSYPSGHAVRSWAIALALVCLDPDHQDEILKVGYEMGQSRVIVGYHYQSDVDAARLAASAAFARMCTTPAWTELLEKAREELRQTRQAQVLSPAA